MAHEHKKGMKCALCDGKSLEEMKDWQDEKTKKCGFVIHCVQGRDAFMNAHTHGFSDTWKHKDFQVVLALPESVISSVFWGFADRVKAGEEFKAGDQVDKIIRGFPVKLVDAVEADRDVLRVIFPDAEGRFPGEKGTDKYFDQQPNIDVSNDALKDSAVN